MNIKHIQNLLSRVDEIKIIGKTAEIDGVVCNIAGIIRPDIPTGILGTKLKAAIIQEPVLGNTDIIEAELFQYHQTVTLEDIILYSCFL